MSSHQVSLRFGRKLLAEVSLLLMLVLLIMRPVYAQETVQVDFWVAAESLRVRGGPTSPEVVGELSSGTRVRATQVCGFWVHIDKPEQGWVFGPALVHSEAELNRRIVEGSIMKKVTLHQFWTKTRRKKDSDNANHFFSWKSGEFPVLVRDGAIVLPEAEQGHGVFIEHFQDDLQGVSLLGKPARMHTGDILVLAADGWQKVGKWAPEAHNLPQVEPCPHFQGEQGMVLVEPLPETAQADAVLSTELLPRYSAELVGRREVRITNPNDFAVLAGIRSEKGGTNLTIPANGQRSAYVPDGRYDIFFVYSSKPNALFQGDSFTLKGNGVEIKIVKVVGGNYGIRQVK